MKERPTRQKIKLDKFKELSYKKRLSNKEIAEFFNIAISSIGAFRKRHNLPPRGHAYQIWNKKYPDYWICNQCNKEFPNITGHKRKFCSRKCFINAKKSGYQNENIFKSGKNHWNWKKERNKLIIRTHKNIFSHKEKNQISKICNYQCKKCGYKFPKLPYYKMKKFNPRFDHIIPIGLNGKHKIKNGQLLCKKCEYIKTKQDHKNIIQHNHNSPFVSIVY